MDNSLRMLNGLLKVRNNIRLALLFKSSYTETKHLIIARFGTKRIHEFLEDCRFETERESHARLTEVQLSIDQILNNIDISDALKILKK